MSSLPLVFAVFNLSRSPSMTSAPLGLVCSCPSCFSWLSHLHPICSPGSNPQCTEIMAVYLLGLIKGSSLCNLCAESCSPFWHCLSSVPALNPSWASLFIFMTNLLGVTHAFTTSPSYPSSSWDFGHLQELQMEFPRRSSRSFGDTRFLCPPILSLTLPLGFHGCLFVCFFNRAKPHLFPVCH